MKQTVLAISITLALALQNASAAEPSLEEKLEILQKEIEQLKAQIAKLPASAQTEASKQTESSSPYAVSAAAGSQGGGAATTVGGYGEAIYNKFRKSGVPDRASLRRAVLFLGHKFNDRLRFNSELEVENAFIEGGEGGEVAMEQAYIEYGVTDWASLRAGLQLVPVGILNETHEPPTFFGAERNQVETLIIPSTWRELALSVRGEPLPGLEYNVGISSSLDSGKFKEPENGLRETRSAGGEAAAKDLAVFGALNYRGIPGLLVGASVFSGDTGQDGASNPALKGIAARMTLWDAHVKYSWRNLDLQALYARGTLDDADKITLATGEVAPKSLFGWYAQAAYHVWKSGDMDLAPFVRYERYNTQNEVAAGFTADPLNNEKVTTLGLNFKLHPQVVFKADYQDFRADNKKDRFNLAVGYLF